MRKLFVSGTVPADLLSCDGFIDVGAITASHNTSPSDSEELENRTNDAAKQFQEAFSSVFREAMSKQNEAVHQRQKKRLERPAETKRKLDAAGPAAAPVAGAAATSTRRRAAERRGQSFSRALQRF